MCPSKLLWVGCREDQQVSTRGGRRIHVSHATVARPSTTQPRDDEASFPSDLVPMTNRSFLRRQIYLITFTYPYFPQSLPSHRNPSKIRRPLYSILRFSPNHSYIYTSLSISSRGPRREKNAYTVRTCCSTRRVFPGGA